MLLSSFSCSGKIQKITIEKADNFPLWLKDSITHTEQTSGIVYINKTSEGSRQFLICDDIGDIYKLEININSRIHIKPVIFSSQVKEFLKSFPKKDFEDITYDRETGAVYLSIEGNGSSYREHVGIYKITFRNNDINSNQITTIERLNIKPENQLLKYTGKNIGFEGIAVDNKYLYLALECGNEIPIFSENTYLYIVNKNTFEIENQIDTRDLKIVSICGLYARSDKNIIGIDRNSKKVFYINFDDSLKISSYAETPAATNIPLYPDLDYIASLESITMDDDKNIYLVDDPWKSQFLPSESILSKLDQTTLENFRKYIPIIYKYKFITSN